MKILHVVTLVDSIGSYGGPTRVAFNQASVLAERGHEVTVVSSSSEYEAPAPSLRDDVRLRIFRARQSIPQLGFAGLSSPGLARWLLKHVANFDVCHIHMARDLVTLPSAAIAGRAGIPFVLQTHGMIDESKKWLTKPVDALLTRPALRRAAKILYLTPAERLSLLQIGAQDSKLAMLRNGVPAVQGSFDQKDHIDVLFMARLDKRKRPLSFALAARDVLPSRSDVRFSIVGPDEGERAELEKIAEMPWNIGKRLILEGPLAPDKTAARLARADIYVLPSVNEPFPMSALEAMAAGKPVIVTSTCGLADEVESSGAGLVVDNTQSSLNSAIEQLILDSSLRKRMGENGRELSQTRFDMSSVSEALENHYREATAHAVDH